MGSKLDRDPVRLTPFEEYMLFDDRPGSPMTFWIRLKFSQPLETARLEQAMIVTAAQHPLLSARIIFDENHRPFWIAAEPSATLRLTDVGNEDWGPPISESFDLACEPPWRIWKSSDRSDCSIWIEFHHSACDGAGAFRAIDDLLNHYVSSRQSTIPLVVGDWEQITTRDRIFQLPLIKDRLMQWAWIIWRTAGYMILRPTSLEKRGSPNECDQIASCQSSFVQHKICTMESIDAFHEASVRYGCTINDLVLSGLFDALCDILRIQQPQGRHRIRVFVPMDLRDNPRNECHVCNVVGMLHVDRVVGMGVDESLSVEEIAREMVTYRKYRMGRAFIFALNVVRRFLGSTICLLSPFRCGATSMFTNLKKPFAGSQFMSNDGFVRVGPLILETIEVLPPVRPMTPACFAIWSYANEVHLCVRFQPLTFSPEDAEFLMNRASEHVKELLRNGNAHDVQRNIKSPLVDGRQPNELIAHKS